MSSWPGIKVMRNLTLRNLMKKISDSFPVTAKRLEKIDANGIW